MTQNTSVKTRNHTAEATPAFGWNWPDEAQLAEFVEQAVRVERDVRAKGADRAEQNDRTLESNTEYAALYFIA